MSAFLPHPAKGDDYAGIRTNGMWYQSWQSGYHDILKRGFPRPDDPEAILAELHSPQVPDFLHGGAASVPFLVRAKVRTVLEQEPMQGFHFAPVVVAKMATLGKRRYRAGGAGEPEDVILKSKGVALDAAPELYAVYVDALVNVTPDHPSGRHPCGNLSPFERPGAGGGVDLWRPSYRGMPYSAWTFCSLKFRALCQSQNWSNISFVPFAEFMSSFRRRCADDG